jgi:transcriptional regulator of arginine metabolism
MLRSARHAKILELISQKEIETQEELCYELNRMNYVVTQATISRDIRDLHLFKVAGVEKKYRYAYISDRDSDISPKMKSLFRDCLLSVRIAQNLIVIKTLEGNGSACGMAIDKLNLDKIVGSIAGDDTLLIVCNDEFDAEDIIDILKEIVYK